MTVTVLNMRVVSEKSGHKVTPLAPNVCITPGVLAGAPGPIPYPIMGTTSKLAKGTKKTKVSGKKILNASGTVKSCSGNEPGSQKDIVSFKTSSKSFPFPVPAVTVHFEGVPVAITGNPGMGNCM